MQKRVQGIVMYLLIAFGAAWLCWLTGWLAGVSATSPLFQLVALPGGFAPAIAALVVRLRITREGLADAGLRLDLRAGKWRYYLFGLVLPLVVMTSVVLLALLTGIAQPDFSLQRAIRALAPGVKSAPLPPFIWPLIVLQCLVMAVVATPILWGEEFGWRSYLQLRLCPGRPLLAALATGLIWGLWHYPLILMGYERYSNPWLGLLLFPIFTMLLAIIFAWLRLRSGSIWASSLAHAATNVIGGNLSISLFAGNSSFSLVAYSGVLAWIPLGLVALWIVLSGRLSAQGHSQAQPAL
jgi:membrane protease YdiL (CAAX protease family)